MKKHFLTLITALLLLAGGLLVYGCEKEPPPPEVEPELQPTLELSVTPEGVVPYGGSIDIRWTADNNTNKVVLVVNGIVKDTRYGSNSRQGALYLDRLFKDALISIVATNVDLSTKMEKEIHVGDWTTSVFGLVSYFPWRYKTQRLRSLDGKILGYLYLDDEEKSWIIYYHKGGTVSYSHTTKVVSWVVPNDDTIIINGTTLKLQIGQEEMVLSYQTMYNGDLIWFDMVFEHASDTPTDPE